MAINYKTATIEDLAAEWRRLAAVTGMQPQYRAEELVALPGLLWNGEKVLALVECQMSFSDQQGRADNTLGRMGALTNERLLFVGQYGFGVEQLSIPLDQITSVRIEQGWIWSGLWVETGAIAHKVNIPSKSAAATFCQMLQETMRAVRRTPQPAAAPAADDEGDLVGQLERLAGLRERGLVTDEEFKAMKAKLLAT